MIDTSVFSLPLVHRTSPLAEQYRPVLLGRPALISFQTAAEIRYGAILAGWGTARLRRVDERLAEVDIIWVGTDLVLVYAQLRANCEKIGHPLAQRIHDADRWIAATAIRMKVPLVAHDNVFRGVPGLDLETLLPT